MDMNLRKKIFWPLLIGSVFGVGLIGYFAFHYSSVFARVKGISTQVIISREKAGDPGVPVRLKIPKIKVDAPVQPVGLTKTGSMDAPKTPPLAGWFDLGSRPGEQGSAVIDGHFGWKDGIPAVFDDLGKLQVGDKIYVEDKNGATRTFVVRRLKTYGENQNAADVFSSNDGVAHLNLITCGGKWNSSTQSYSDRLVVFADMEPGV